MPFGLGASCYKMRSFVCFILGLVSLCEAGAPSAVGPVDRQVADEMAVIR